MWPRLDQSKMLSNVLTHLQQLCFLKTANDFHLKPPTRGDPREIEVSYAEYAINSP